MTAENISKDEVLKILQRLGFYRSNVFVSKNTKGEIITNILSRKNGNKYQMKNADKCHYTSMMGAILKLRELEEV